MIEILTHNHFESILDLFDSAKKEIKIISPFVTMSMVTQLCEAVTERHLSCTFITRFYMEDFLAKVNSLDALELMLNCGIEVLLLKRLHTKLYLFDKDDAVLGSANFTNGGFKSNFELSLHLSTEQEVISELQVYFEDLAAKIRIKEDGILTQNHIDTARNTYSSAYSSKKHQGTGHAWNTFMVGAALTPRDEMKQTDEMIKELKACEAEQNDIITSLFKMSEKVEQINYPYNIWLKFNGEADARYSANDKLTLPYVTLNGRVFYVSNYPTKPTSVQSGDDIYIAALTTDKRGKNQPVIVGRGKLKGFSEANYVTDEMVASYDWMERYPWYCEVTDCKILDTSVSNGIPLNVILDALRSDTYVASFGRNESIPEVERKHYQKAHIRLSGNAKQLIDKLFDDLLTKYGFVQI